MLFVNYRSFSATSAWFSETVIQLLEKIPEKEKVLTISIFGMVSDKDYLSNLEIIRQTAQQVFGQIPLLNYVAQSPENEHNLIAEVGYLPDSISTSAVSYHDFHAGRYLTIETKEFSALLVEGVMSDNIQQSIGEQSLDVFNKIQQILHTASMPAENIVRQWNYIGHITGVENNSQNYQEFNNERSRFYASSNWKNGYPAATGISMDIHAVIVSMIAVKFHDTTRIFPVNNSLQFAAHCYSKTVLGNSEKKETPKFERAKLIVSGKSACCYISGTAAILGEKSLADQDVKTQASQTIALIRHLISAENLKVNGIDFSGDLKIVHLRVYIKKIADYETVRSVLEAELPRINAFYVCAGVCREELLVEIEGVAITES
ncbi:MAG: Rid family hydrolase [Paludibacter sp.]